MFIHVTLSSSLKKHPSSARQKRSDFPRWTDEPSRLYLREPALDIQVVVGEFEGNVTASQLLVDRGEGVNLKIKTKQN